MPYNFAPKEKIMSQIKKDTFVNSGSKRFVYILEFLTNQDCLTWFKDERETATQNQVDLLELRRDCQGLSEEVLAIIKWLNVHGTMLSINRMNWLVFLPLFWQTRVEVISSHLKIFRRKRVTVLASNLKFSFCSARFPPQIALGTSNHIKNNRHQQLKSSPWNNCSKKRVQDLATDHGFRLWYHSQPQVSFETTNFVFKFYIKIMLWVCLCI